MNSIQFNTIHIQKIHSFSYKKDIEVYVLRLDVMHPIVSGNKWFKLHQLLQHAVSKKCTTIATFGGAFSNHILATAYACQAIGLKSIGIIRGEEPLVYSFTLQQAQALGMQLQFVSRADFSKKELLIDEATNTSETYIIPEGGYSILGAKGVEAMYRWIDDSFTHIVCAVGTGTMMAGLINGALPHQNIVGISVLKGYDTLINEIEQLLVGNKKSHSYQLMHQYHFGGYAKHPPSLINWMNQLYKSENLPTDIVYTSKMMYGLHDMILQGHFAPGSKIIAIHSGGLQGNDSLPKTALLF